MLQKSGFQRTILSALALALATLAPATTFAGPSHHDDKGDDEAQQDDKGGGDAKKLDPKRAKATKKLPAAPAKASADAPKKPPSKKKLDAKVEVKQRDVKKADVDVDAKKAEVKKPETKKVAVKKTETKKVAVKKTETKRTDAKKTELKVAAKSTTVKKPKVVASRGAVGRKKLKAPPKPCNGVWVSVDRGGLEPEKMPLVDCKGRPLASSQEHLSVLVRPWGAARPKIATHEGLIKADERGEIAPGVRLLDGGLVTRLDAIARHFKGKSFSFVSGYRPQSRGSNHQSGRAVDMRVVGVTNEELVAYCKTLRDTGCGYYPNSSFVHVDVRNPGTGGVSWIDASGPGEAPRYVSSWPPPKVHGTDPANREERVPPPVEDEPHDDVTSEQLPKNRLGEVPEHPLL